MSRVFATLLLLVLAVALTLVLGLDGEGRVPDSTAPRGDAAPAPTETPAARDAAPSRRSEPPAPGGTPAPAEGSTRPGTLHGRIVDPFDQPIPDCRVHATHRTAAHPGRPDTAAAAPTRTATDGRFALAVPFDEPVLLVLEHPSYPATMVSTGQRVPAGGELRLDPLVLRARPALVVEVQDRRGDPVAGAEVHLRPDLDDPFQPVAWAAARDRTGWTDGAGRATLPAVQAGPSVLTVRNAEHAPHFRRLTLERADAARRLTVTLEPGRTLTGLVLGGDGRPPIVGARVHARSQGFTATATTDGGGAFRIGGLPPAPCSVEVHVPGHGTWQRRGIEPGGPPLRIVLPAGETLTGRVLHSGRPVAGAGVGVRTEEGWPLLQGGAVYRPRTRTGPDGGFTLGGLPEGRFLLDVTSEGFVTATSGPHPAGGPPVVVALARGATVTGKVLDARGPVEGATITVISTSPSDLELPAALQRRLGVAPPRATARTGRGGRFRLEGLPAGDWRLRVGAAPRLAPALSEPFGARPGRTHDVGVVHLPAAARIRGTARTEDGDPAAGARVVARPLEPGIPVTPHAEGTSDAAGRFSLGPLAPGRYEVFYSFAAESTASGAVSLHRRTRVEVRLEAGQTLTQDLRPR